MSMIAEFDSEVPSAQLRRRSKRYFSAATKKWRRSGQCSQKRNRIRSATVIKLLADANIQGQVALLAAAIQTEPWHEFWNYLDLRLLAFSDAGLDSADSDAIVWQHCQQQDIFLITNNRND